MNHHTPYDGNLLATSGVAGGGGMPGTPAGPTAEDPFSALVREAVSQARAGVDNSAQLSLVLAVLETELKRQEEVRKTTELELEIVKLSQLQSRAPPAFPPSVYDWNPAAVLNGPNETLQSSHCPLATGSGPLDLNRDYDDSWLNDLSGWPSSSSTASSPASWFGDTPYATTLTPPATSLAAVPMISAPHTITPSPDSRVSLPPPAVPFAASAVSAAALVKPKRPSTDTRKRIEEVAVNCKNCNINVSAFILHYDKAHNMVDCEYTIDVLCRGCTGRPEVASAVAVSSSKKRLHDELDIDCEICKRRIGSGGFKFKGDDAVARVGGGGKICGDDIVGATAVNFRAEILCASCKSKYRLCTECGGGGRFRTGKYRPMELFAEGRRTCSLSHVRIGGAPLFFEIYSAPAELTDKLISETRDVHIDGFSGLYMCPEIIEVPAGNLDSFAKMESWCYEGWQGAENLIRTEKAGLKKYLAAVYFDQKSSKMRGTGSKRTMPATTTDSGATPPPASTRFQVGYLMMEWDIANGTALLTNGYLRSMAPSTLPILRGLAERLLRKALEDRAQMRDPSVPEIRHIWVLARRQHARLQALCQRMGMMSLDQYLQLNPDVDKQIFMREVHVSRALFVEIVSSVPEYLQSG
ncbi:hypothetical protein HDU87_006037 [Geranomyces variabilis]|uniref:Uncharacterized protein n=1 Tax=Geranomyces variabilis TaxID=109894 RepID=A0AAD5TQY4_9FUNG|nr:hypothetical protein HDU87_006037 [Geranomyces variabilis]